METRKTELNGNKRPKAPVKMFVEWSGSKGAWTTWNKAEQMEVSFFTLEGIVIAERHGIRGWSDKYHSKIYSNEVKSLDEPLAVFVFDNGLPKKIMEGRYTDIKDRLKAMGGKYARLLYWVMPSLDDAGNETGELIHVTLIGSALNWIDATKGRNLYDTFITAERGKLQKKGATSFFAPTWKFEPADPLSVQRADEIYEHLFLPWWQEYSGWKQPEAKPEVKQEILDDAVRVANPFNEPDPEAVERLKRAKERGDFNPDLPF